MRFYLNMVVGLFLMNSLTAQPTSIKPLGKKQPANQRPSTVEMNAQMMEALVDLRKQIDEMEKEIAMAKENKEDPESIQQMESHLISTKKLLASMEKLDPSGPPKVMLPAHKTVLPETHKSQIIPIPFRQPVVYPSREQAKDTLFWYVGRKLDDTTLLTPDRMVVRISSTRNIIILQPELRRDTPMYIRLANGLAQIQRIKSDFVINIDGIQNSFFMFPEIEKAYDEFSMQADRYYNMAKNTLPFDPIDNLFTQRDFELMRRELLAMQDQLKQLMANLPLANIDGAFIENNLPPKRPVDLCWCDQTQRNAFESKLNTWSSNFYKEERELQQRSAKLQAQLQKYRDLGFRGSIPDWNRVLIAAQRLMIDRQSKKLVGLTEHYEANPDIFMEEGLAAVTINLQNSLSMLKIIEADDPAREQQAKVRIERVKRIFVNDKHFKEYIKEQMSAHNFIVIFDYGLYASHESSKAALTGEFQNIVPFTKRWITRLKEYNRFTLKMDLDFLVHDVDEEEKVLMTADGLLSSDEVIVSLGQLGCKWQFYLTRPNHRNRGANEKEFYVPFKVVKGLKDYTNDKKDPFRYSGPDSMKMVFPSIRIGFCDQSPDSVIMSILRYDDDGLREYPKSSYDNEYSTDMNAYVVKMFIGIEKTRANRTQFENVAADMINLATRPHVSNSAGDATLNNIKAGYSGSIEKHELQRKAAQVTQTTQSIILFDANSGDPLFIDKIHPAATGSDPDIKVSRILIKGDVTIKSKHQCDVVGCTAGP